jgi:hypothetical protein
MTWRRSSRLALHVVQPEYVPLMSSSLQQPPPFGAENRELLQRFDLADIIARTLEYAVLAGQLRLASRSYRRLRGLPCGHRPRLPESMARRR